jgi:hypothetical protein
VNLNLDGGDQSRRLPCDLETPWARSRRAAGFIPTRSDLSARRWPRPFRTGACRRNGVHARPAQRGRARQERLNPRPLLVGQIRRLALGLLLNFGHPATRGWGPHPNLESRPNPPLNGFSNDLLFLAWGRRRPLTRSMPLSSAPSATLPQNPWSNPKLSRRNGPKSCGKSRMNP